MGSYRTSHEEPNLVRTWSTLSSLFPEIKEHLSPENINEHRNCLTLMSLFHPPFRQFKLSFEPAVDDNVYQVTTYSGFHGGLARDLLPPNERSIRLVEFKQHADFELPSRTLLGIHAALARVMHVSGMGERIEKILRDRQTLRCLTPDGSTDVNSFLIVP